ncbi:hypothetical protein [Hyphomonas sp. UBA4494]|jgi:hypothetical protein|uniref:hypothetical protein n=1 Tax=Hyphomonas sp. UBA4494 TaxID=1946631 RepID=UPI0025BA2517|nr:hypothetical protein [Hyphomonas sp. UBA4494]
MTLTPEMKAKFPEFFEATCEKCGHTHLGTYKTVNMDAGPVRMAAVHCLCGHMFTVKDEEE